MHFKFVKMQKTIPNQGFTCYPLCWAGRVAKMKNVGRFVCVCVCVCARVYACPCVYRPVCLCLPPLEQSVPKLAVQAHACDCLSWKSSLLPLAPSSTTHFTHFTQSTQSTHPTYGACGHTHTHGGAHVKAVDRCTHARTHARTHRQGRCAY